MTLLRIPPLLIIFTLPIVLSLILWALLALTPKPAPTQFERRMADERERAARSRATGWRRGQ